MIVVTNLLPALYLYFFSYRDISTLHEHVYLCIYLQPCITGDEEENKPPIELSGYRIVDVGLMQQSLKSCEHCKSGKKPINC